MRRFLLSLLTFSSLLLFIGCSSDGDQPAAKPHFETSQQFVTQAVVTEVDHENRLITVRHPDGEIVTAAVDPAVSNFEHVNAGDILQISVFESVVLEVVETDDLSGELDIVAGESMLGDSPQIGGVESLVARARITEIDRENRSLTLVGEEGIETTFKVGRDVSNLDALEVGDVVQASITLSVTIAAHGEQESSDKPDSEEK